MPLTNLGGTIANTTQLNNAIAAQLAAVTFTDNGDGTATVNLPLFTDNGDGTATIAA